MKKPAQSQFAAPKWRPRRLGMTDIMILLPPTGPRNCVSKLSSEGRLIASFGFIGPGPTELEHPNGFRISQRAVHSGRGSP